MAEKRHRGGWVEELLRQGCVMSLWLFNIFFGRVVRQVNERLSWREMKLTDENGRGGEIKQILYADDTAGGRNKRAFPTYCE